MAKGLDQKFLHCSNPPVFMSFCQKKDGRTVEKKIPCCSALLFLLSYCLKGLGSVAESMV